MAACRAACHEKVQCYQKVDKGYLSFVYSNFQGTWKGTFQGHLFG